ncbi:MAG TPA: PTS sugar transporter subunit IIA [Lacunisphaera sp.]|nr:PTS sugar transporter subunit IIA [Lacunisphaera sp.]
MYLNLVQIAESFGVAEKVVEDWIRSEGLPHMLDRGRPLFDRAQVADWAAARGLAAQAGFLAPETQSPFSTGIRLEPLLRAGGIWRDVAAADIPKVWEKIVGTLPGVTPAVRQLLGQRLRGPGGVTMAPVGGGLALPHPSTRVALGREAGTLALLLVREPVPGVEPPDGVPVTRLFFFIAPSSRAHLDLLGRLSRALGRGPLRQQVLQGASDDEIFLAVAASDEGAAKGGARP